MSESKLPSAESEILKTLLLQSVLQAHHVYDEVIVTMHSYSEALLREFAERVKKYSPAQMEVRNGFDVAAIDHKEVDEIRDTLISEMKQ